MLAKFNKSTVAKAPERGFTLIEIMIVVAIIAVMAATVGAKLFGNVAKAKHTKVQSDIQALSAQLSIYRLDNNNFPSTDQGLQALVAKPSGEPEAANWKQLLDKVPKDPWGREYLYLSPGEHGEFDLYSLGRDGRSGGEDEDADIGNWQ